MKYIPNFLTICNLVLGCCAIMFTLSAPTYMNTIDYENYYPIVGIEQMQWGAACIMLAAFCDVLDGLAARVLKAFSPIGKDLDSLADVVSFGVAPSMILYQFLWCTYMAEPGALDTPTYFILPAFAIAAFAALRLARFNITSLQQKSIFNGLPVPAVGILVACLPMIALYQSQFQHLLLNKWFLYGLIILLSYLMVSNIQFFKWQGAGKNLKSWMPQILVAVSLLIGILFLGWAGVYVAFLVYLLLSLFNKPGATVA
jgi:CDP-diacylglycerol--serine O-phosphatidyltransferase